MRSKCFIFVIILAFIYTSCGKVDEKTKKELQRLKTKVEKLESKIKLKEKKIKELQKFSKEEKEVINRKNLVYLNGLLLKFKAKKKRAPENAKEFRRFAGKMPLEMFSGSRRITDTPDSKGGWYYDKKKLVIKVNELD